MYPDHLDLLTAAMLVCVGIVIGVLLDHYILPAVVDAWIGRLRRRGG